MSLFDINWHFKWHKLTHFVSYVVKLMNKKQQKIKLIKEQENNSRLKNMDENSLEYAITRDKLIRQHKLPEDPVVKSNDDYWKKFK